MPKAGEHMDVQPSTIAIAQPALDVLHPRLAMARLPDEVPGTGWGLGTNLAYLRDLVHYWRAPFGLRAPERGLNAPPPVRARGDGMRGPLIHLPRRRAPPTPLLLPPVGP